MKKRKKLSHFSPSFSIPKMTLKLVLFILSLFFLSLTFLVLNKKFHATPNQNDIQKHQQNPRWHNVLRKETQGKKLKIGLVNMDEIGKNDEISRLGETVVVRFDRVDKNRQWSDFFPKWIDEEERQGPTTCPKIPMPEFEDYQRLDVVVARVPCGRGAEREGIKDVFRLQLNLVVANLLVRSGCSDHNYDGLDRTVYAVFIGSCGPMREIFRCDDLLFHEDDDIFVYRPNLRKLKQKVLMPVGTCQIAPLSEEPGEEMWRSCGVSTTSNTFLKPREAYVTVLHSSNSFVCGAIALAQTLIQTNTTKDLVLLTDDSISKTSLQGLREAGWKIKHTERIRSPSRERKIFSEWNYSKLRVWQLTEYDKIICIDSDLIVLQNMDEFFVYPQLSAVGEKSLVFNSGVMLVEPSKCMFETLMEKMDKVASYDATDQGFLNEMFTWWHRWPSKVNSITLFDEGEDKKHEMIKNPYAIHYLGIKPWMCQTDHDCNWDVPGLDRFASDSAHKRWVQVYDSLPKRLQSYCEVTLREDPNLARIKKWRESYKNGNWNWKTYLFIVLLIFFSFLALSQRLWITSAIVYGSSLVFHKICKNEIKEKNGKGK
ncbi:putative UDP-glucuronate:xylan alpha-glucuronosyltransferase 4 [Actinidia eriantha]|uniref:putative UDP-glucuronate:xylan alpha-glucuronosyltransferase 4 n=1 Tax=Actinidia eriantha TaxID=165200 RepID=UPI00258B9247|nr:putative UDP-glucuronate:xylan alpha-glucuronosyltransferase 4 [Actinidia eriantha]